MWLWRKTNKDFADDFEDALKAGALLLEAEAIRRAQDGVTRMKFNPRTGEPYIDPRTGQPYMEHEYSDTLMLALLKRNFAEYREPKADVNVSTQVHNHIVAPEKLKALRERHSAALQGTLYAR